MASLSVASNPLDPFEKGRLGREDARLLQAALSFTGDYLGRLDGDWGPRSVRALHAATGESPAELAVLKAILPFLEDFDVAGWQAFNPDGGTSFLMPDKLLLFDRATNFLEFRTTDRTLIERYMFRDGPDSGQMDDWLQENHVGRIPFYRADTSEAFISSGQTSSAHVYLRTRDMGGTFETVLVQWSDRQANRARIIVASLSNRPQSIPMLDDSGYLASILSDIPVDPAPDQNDQRRVVSSDPSVAGTGTGFHVNATDLITAAHVVRGCAGISLSDGTNLRVLASKTEADLAVLTGPARSTAYLEIAGNIPIRIGTTVTALGYPYFGLLDQGLTVSGGNVSALRGLDGNDRSVMMTAPVQPGNSGGPLLDRKGRVLGVVVARADDDFVLNRSGVLPQNLNQAITHIALLSFLDTHRILLPAPSGLGYDMTGGLPDALIAATVLVRCHS